MPSDCAVSAFPALRAVWGLLALAVANALPAQVVVPVNYTATPAQGQAVGGSWNYFDDTGTQLIDGVLGVDNWTANLGNGNAYEWVGWLTIQPVITFNFSLPVTVTSVTLGLSRDEGAGIYIPPSITIGGESFSLASNAFANSSRADLTFNLTRSVAGNQLMLTVNNIPGQWAFVDEVKFTAVPEPSSLGLLGCGAALLACLAWFRTRRNAAGGGHA